MKQLDNNDVLKQALQPYEKCFDIVRIVDPIQKTIISSKNHETIPINATCYSLWLNNEVCQNCITIKALNENDTFLKIQHNIDKMYLMFATPIEINGKVLVLELLKDITDNLVFETVDLQSGHEVRNMTQDLNSLLIKDPLTNLFNRRYINQILPSEMLKSLTEKYPISIAMVDIDNFKDVNDTYGHVIGDKVIKNFGQTLTRFIRDGVDWVARYGGDEFLVYLNNTNSKRTYMIFERMRKAIEQMNIFSDHQKVKVTGTFGVCTLQGNEMEVAELIKCADNKLYEGKKKGRNIVIT